MNEGLEKTFKGERNALESKKKEILAMMNTLSDMCLEEMKSSLDRTKIETLVTIMVH